MNESRILKQGSEVLEYLAGLYPQIYLLPTEEGNPLYRDVVLSGEDAPEHTLSHFITDPNDCLTMENTPAGEVMAVTMTNRSDFETLLRIMAHKCKTVPVPATQGASILDGVISWSKIRAHEKEFIEQEEKKGNPNPDTDAEFERFTADKKNYTDALILLSCGPYSGISFERTPFEEAEWKDYSLTIRKAHECTHFICRRLYHEWIDGLWDELVADAVGIYAALGRYDQDLAEVFLGISGDSYVGGRLENYLPEEEKTPAALNLHAARIHAMLTRFNAWINDNQFSDPWDLAVRLEENYPLWWKNAE